MVLSVKGPPVAKGGILALVPTGGFDVLLTCVKIFVLTLFCVDALHGLNIWEA